MIESDHNLILNLQFSKIKSERIDIFNFRNSEAQHIFRNNTSEQAGAELCQAQVKLGLAELAIAS